MKRTVLFLILICLCVAGLGISAQKYRKIRVTQYVDKMKAGWIGQMAGVGWGGPTEFRFKGKIIPEHKMPAWKPGLINQFNQDDIYVEMTFLRTLEIYGLDVSIRQAGIDFANSGYRLWHANRNGRDNLRSGIAPPDSGHPKFNKHADDIDYQIESDYSGLISPGLPNACVKLGEIFGRLMNYGDGLYGGQFVSGMYAEAFFEDDMVKIINAGLKCIPGKSQYSECIRDVLKWYKKYPGDWTKTWELINNKYQKLPEYRRFSCSKSDFNIDAKINGAYIVTGLLYGGGDMDKSIVIATRCGQDSDCNPSSAGGIVATTIGFARLPERFKSALDPKGKFSHTPYNFPKLVDVCKKLAHESVLQEGGRVEKDNEGNEVFIIPVEKPRTSRFEQCWDPGPVVDSKFTDAEMEKINMSSFDLSKVIEKFAPGWKISKCNMDMDPGLRAELNGKKNVLVTHPLNKAVGCVLWKKVNIPAGKKTTLDLTVGHDPRGDWLLIVKAGEKEIFRKLVGKKTSKSGWLDLTIDLSQLAGKKTKLQLINRANNWSWETGFWAKIKISSSD